MTESVVSKTGKVLFGADLDFAWCHLVLKAADLKRILPEIKSRDLTVFAEIVFSLRKSIITRDVDWLSWDDPYILGKDAGELKSMPFPW